MLKKIVSAVLGCFLLGLIIIFQGDNHPVDLFMRLFLTQNEAPEQTPVTNRLKTTRKIPQDVNWGAFLSAQLAQNTKDYPRAQQYIQQVLKTDPDNNELKELLYVVAGINGDIKVMIPLAETETTLQNEPSFMTPYILIADKVKNKEYQEALDILQVKGQQRFASTLNILLRVWCFAGLDKEKEAFDALNMLEKEKVNGLYLYNHALLNTYFKHDDQAKEDYFQATAQDAGGNMLVSIKDFFEKKGEWSLFHPLYGMYQTALQNYPVLHDSLAQIETRALQSPQDAVAEAFFQVSSAFYDQKVTDQALLYNNLALYLSPDNLMFKIYGARLYEILQLFPQANKLYDEIGMDADIMLFKKAVNLMTQGNNKEALLLMREVEKHNRGNSFVQSFVGQLYAHDNQFKEAIKHYTFALKALQNGKDTDVAEVYFSRARCYKELNDFNAFQLDMFEALQLNPDHAEMLNYLGYEWLVHDENLAEATKFIEKANQITPNQAHIQDSLALAYYKSKEYNKALDLAEKAVDKIGASSVANMHLGDIYEALGRHREAISQYEKALALKMDLTAEIKEELQKRLAQK